MREKLARFFAGRNGVDQLGRAVTFVTLAVLVVSMFTHGRVSEVLFILALLGIVYMYFRMFSKNVAKRRAENAKFMQKTYSMRTWFRGLGERWRQRREYKFFRCPGCGTLLRVPRGKGRIKIVCHKCGNSFIKRS